MAKTRYLFRVVGVELEGKDQGADFDMSVTARNAEEAIARVRRHRKGEYDYTDENGHTGAYVITGIEVASVIRLSEVDLR